MNMKGIAEPEIESQHRRHGRVGSKEPNIWFVRHIMVYPRAKIIYIVGVLDMQTGQSNGDTECSDCAARIKLK